MRILVITSVYPTLINSQTGSFVYELVKKLSDLGNQITVICPQKIKNILSRSDQGSSGVLFNHDVLYPNFFSFSNKIIFGRFSTLHFTLYSFLLSVVLKSIRNREKPDLVYSHFLFPAGFCAYHIAAFFKVKSIVALGESDLNYYIKHFGIAKVRETIYRIDGVISVSYENLRFCVDVLGVDADKIIIARNGVDTNLFNKIDKVESRKHLNINTPNKIIVFVGHFNNRKGVHRLLEATKDIENVELILIGGDESSIQCKRLLFCGLLPHDQVPYWVSAADIFVLPTLAEGSCNAVLEAMSLGVPVITSNISSMKELISEGEGILVDPESIIDIRQSIVSLIEDESLMDAIGEAGYKRSLSFSLNDRAIYIDNYLSSILE